METARDMVNKVVEMAEYKNKLSKKFYDFLVANFSDQVDLACQNIIKDDKKYFIKIDSHSSNAQKFITHVVISEFPYWQLNNKELTLGLDKEHLHSSADAYSYALKLFNSKKEFELVPETYIMGTTVKFSDIEFDKQGNVVPERAWKEFRRQIGASLEW